MFGFLIAMIKRTFDRGYHDEVSNKYMSRCEMNQVSYNFYRIIPFNVDFETDLVVVSGLFADPIEINLGEDEIWRKDIEGQIQNVLGNQDKMMKMIEELMK